MSIVVTYKRKGKPDVAVMPSWGNYPGKEVVMNEVLHVPDDVEAASIFSRYPNSEDLVRILMINNALHNEGVDSVSLTIPYLPYARQDRAVNGVKGNQAFALEVFAQIINTAQFDEVRVQDMHSAVPAYLIHNLVQTFDRTDLLQAVVAGLRDRTGSELDLVVVAPDEGASARTKLAADELNLEVVYAKKQRNPATGQLSGFEMSDEDVRVCSGKDLIVLDDICDGGGTFLGVMQMIRQRTYDMDVTGPNFTFLAVTHGIFSKGLDVMAEQFDAVFAHTVLDPDLALTSLRLKGLDSYDGGIYAYFLEDKE